MIVPPYNSCSDEGYFFIWSFNPDYVNRGDSVVLWVEGGVPPYDWQVSGITFTLAQSITADQCNVVTATALVVTDVVETVTVIDSCGTVVSGTVCCCGVATPCCDTLPAITYSADNPEIFKAGETWEIVIEGGCPPFKWETLPPAYSDYHFEKTYTNARKNTLHLNTAGKVFWIRVTDACGTKYGSDTYYTGSACVIFTDEDFDKTGGFRWFGFADGCLSAGYSPPNWDPENPESKSPGDCDYFGIVNGLPLFTYWIAEQGYIPTDAEDQLVVISGARTITACANEDGDAFFVLGVLDICGGSDHWYVDIYNCCSLEFNPGYNFEFDDTLTADTILPGSHETIYTSGGCPPFSWTVSGSGFSFASDETDTEYNQLDTSASACGPGGITVNDACGNVVTGTIRCTAGSWSPGTVYNECYEDALHQCPNGAAIGCGWLGAGTCTAGSYVYSTNGIYRYRYGPFWWCCNATHEHCWGDGSCLAIPYVPPCGTADECTSMNPGQGTCTGICLPSGLRRDTWIC